MTTKTRDTRQGTESIHRLLTGLPEAKALRMAAAAWVRACQAQPADANDSTADRANRWLLSAAVDFARAVKREGRKAGAREAWESVAAEHMALCHSDGTECEDGCDKAPVRR